MNMAFENPGMGDQAGQELQQEQPKSFLFSLLMADMLLKTSSSFKSVLDSFLKSNEMWSPEKWDEFLKSATKIFNSASEIDPFGIGSGLLKELQPMGGSDSSDGDEGYFIDDGGGGSISDDYSAELGAATSSAEISHTMQENFSEFMGEYMSVDIGNIINAGGNIESASESNQPSPPEHSNVRYSRGAGM